MADGLRVRVLGPLEVTCAGRAIGPAGPRRRSLFALLALRPNEVCTVDGVVDGLWGAGPPASATGVVQTYISTWRKALAAAGDSGADRIVTAGNGYRLRLADEECDLLQFRRLVERGRRAAADGAPDDGRRALEAALALWRGPVLADLTGQPFHRSAAAAVEEQRAQASEHWADLVLRTAPDADLTAVVDTLQDLRRTQPWRERVSELLLWALFRQGRQAEALAVYAATRRALAEELGVDPGPSLRAMHDRVLRQDAELQGAVAARPAGTAGTHPSAPLRLDAFVGRGREVDEVLALLDTSRLVTLTGPGGSGKTRLAEEVAGALRRRSGAAAVVVELAPLDDPALVPGTIAARLGLSSAEPLEGLIALLDTQSMLLVLDNLEHLPGIGPAVAALLRGTTGVRVLATSREPLRVAGEQQYAVPPLGVPAAGETDVERLGTSPSVELLVARARATDPHFTVTAENASVLGQIVRAVDGLPLALEIVAPWLRPLTPDGVLDHLRAPLDIPSRDGAERRHRTLRDTIAWSHDRLSSDERLLLARLSVFRGGADLDAITAVGGPGSERPVVDVLVDLVDRNLVQPAGAIARRPRFRLLETVRQFAAERLAADGESETTLRRAADWFAGWAVGLARHSEGPATSEWLDRAVADADNLRAAMDHLDRSGQPEAHLQLVVDAMVLWFEAGHEREGERRLTAALERAPTSAARAVGLAYLAWLVGTHDRSEAARLASEAVGLARRDGDLPVLAFALQTLGDTVDDLDAAVAASTEAGRLARDLARDPGVPIRYGPTAGDAVACGAAHTLAALWAHRSLPTALEFQRRALTLAEAEGDRRITAVNSARLGLLHLLGGDPGSAAGPIARAGTLMTGPVTARWEDIVAFAQGCLLQWQGRRAEAQAAFADLTTSALAGGRLLHVGLGSCGLADLLIDGGAYADADAVLRRAETVLAVGVDARQRARLQVRRARLLRLDGRPAEAAALLAEAGSALPEDSLGPERIVWFVETLLLESDPGRVRVHLGFLEQLSARTGVHVPPWERALLAAVDGRAR